MCMSSVNSRSSILQHRSHGLHTLVEVLSCSLAHACMYFVM